MSEEIVFPPQMVKGSVEVECLDIHMDFVQEWMGRYAAEIKAGLADIGATEAIVSFATSDGICEYY